MLIVSKLVMCQLFPCFEGREGEVSVAVGFFNYFN